MTYFQGFVTPVKIADKQADLDMAKKAAPIFAEYGAARSVECWGDDVMDGKVTDLKKAVQANDDETVVFSWVWWPDKATCDAAAEKIMADDRMKPDGPMPFDGKRMIYAGFDANFDTGDGGKFGYVDAVVASIPNGNRQGLKDHAAHAARLFQAKGALRVVDGWGADVPAGKVTDFKRAVPGLGERRRAVRRRRAAPAFSSHQRQHTGAALRENHRELDTTARPGTKVRDAAYELSHQGTMPPFAA